MTTRVQPEQTLQYCTTMRDFFAFDLLLEELEANIRLWELQRRVYMSDTTEANLAGLGRAHDDWIRSTHAIRTAFAERLPTDEMTEAEYTDFCERASIEELPR